MNPNGFWQRSAVKAAVATTVFAWMPVVVAYATLKSPLASDIEYAIRGTLESWLAAFGIVRWGAPSQPIPPPQ